MPSEFLSELHEEAIGYARDGIPIFVCKELSKEPAVAGGFLAATTDESIINGWFQKNPNFNIALCPENSGWLVGDIEQEGLADWNKYGAPRTFTVRTPRDGRHFYFKGSGPSKVRFMNGYAWDTRGRGGYVLLPPSRVLVDKGPYKGQVRAYETIDDAPLTDIPEFLRDALSTREHEKQAAPTNVELDTPTSINAAKDFLARHPPPTVGERNVKTFPMACQLKDLGLSRDTIIELLLPWCGLDIEELTITVESAIKNGQNEIGCDARRPMPEAFAGIEIPAEPKPKQSRLRCIPEPEQDTEPPVEWQYETLLPSRGAALVFGASGAHKSFLMLDLALGISSGLEAWGLKPQKPGMVVYGALEGRSEMMRKRRPAWRRARGVEGVLPFYMSRAPRIGAPGECQEFIEQIKLAAERRPVRAIFLETAAKMLVGLDATKDVPRLVQYCEDLVETFNCVVVVSHHAGHDSARGPKDSSTYEQAFDTVIQITTPKRGSRISEAWVRKHKDAPEPEHPFTFKGETKVVRGEGDEQVVVELGSLVFNRTTAEEHAALVPADDKKLRVKKVDIYHETNVGNALRELKAIGRDYAVATAVLAGKIVTLPDSASTDERQAKVKEATSRLNTLSKNKLEAYCSLGTKGEPLWHAS